MQTKKRLSSEYLFHYTRKLEYLKGILARGFQFRMNEEVFPIEILDRSIFMICFCDIKLEEAATHRKDYGDFAIVLKKMWGVEHGVTPVQYIHKNSIPRSDDYWQIKALFGDVIIEAAKGNDKHVEILLTNSLLIDALKKVNRVTEREFYSKRAKFRKQIREAFSNFTEEQKLAFAKYLSSLSNRLLTFNALFERRNAYLKAYRGKLARGKGSPRIKVFYDEREWRAVKFITVKHQMDDKGYYNRAIKSRRLPDECNLRFSDDDVVRILVENQESVDEIKKFIRTGDTSLTYEAVKDKIYQIDQVAATRCRSTHWES